MLVLDECHEISGTEWQGRILTLLIDGRYRERRDTILITNHAQEAFLASVGESVADRIAECGFFIQCDWPSFRRADCVTMIILIDTREQTPLNFGQDVQVKRGTLANG